MYIECASGQVVMGIEKKIALSYLIGYLINTFLAGKYNLVM